MFVFFPNFVHKKYKTKQPHKNHQKWEVTVTKLTSTMKESSILKNTVPFNHLLKLVWKAVFLDNE